MKPENRSKLAERVIRAAEAALAARDYMSPIDVLVGIGWLDAGAVKRWRQGQIEFLENIVGTKLSRISEAMKLFRSWAAAKALRPSETHCVASELPSSSKSDLMFVRRHIDNSTASLFAGRINRQRSLCCRQEKQIPCAGDDRPLSPRH